MGRARITMKHISNEKARKTTFMQRRKGLIKKMSEFSTLCGVKACLIVYDDGNGDVGPVTWPQDPAVVHSIIQNYKLQLKNNERPHKTFHIQDFFENRKNTVEAEISKVHKQITNIMYPTWDPSFKNMEEEQLRAFIALVDAKIRACENRISMLKNKNQSEANFSFIQNTAQGSVSSSHPSQITLIPPMKPLHDTDRMVGFTNLINRVDGDCNHGINMLRNMQQGDDCFSYMTQERANATSSHPSQSILEALEPLNDKNEMVDFSNEVVVPLDSTNQLGDSMDWADQLDDFEDWINGPIGSSNQLGDDLVGWPSQPGHDFENLVNGPMDWSNQLGDNLVGWASQSQESVLQNIPVQSQNQHQGGGALHALQLPPNGFQTDFYNMLF